VIAALILVGFALFGENLLAALHFDPFGFDAGLLAQLLADAHRIGTRLFDDVPALDLALFDALGVKLVGRGQSLGGLGAVGQLVGHRLFLVGHQLAHRRDHVLDDDRDDDGEADELSDEG